MPAWLSGEVLVFATSHQSMIICATVIFGPEPSYFDEGRLCSLYTCAVFFVHLIIFSNQLSYFEAEALHARSVLVDGRLAVLCRVGSVGEEHALVAF